MLNATPRLRADVAVRPFDAADGDCRFVVAVGDRHFLVSAAVAAVLEESREAGSLASIAQRVSLRLGIAVSPEQVARLLREQAPPVLFESTPELRTAAGPLHFRRIILNACQLRPLLQVLARLFTQRWAVLFAVSFLVVESLVFARALAASPVTTTGPQVVAASVLTVLGVLVHELGHLSACVRYRASHGGIGVGLYWCVPVFFAEVHGAWLLARQQRAVVDAGGLYLQSLYVMVLGGMYLASGAPAVLATIVCSHYLMLHTLNPVLKYDGYWLLSDLTGAHNLHQSVRRIAAGAWRAVGLQQTALMPDRRELALLGGFLVAALAYFVYTLALLGDGLANTAARAIDAWASLRHTHAARAAIDVLYAAGETLLLVALLFMAGGIALLLARALGSITQEPSHDR
jgi:putative peptide zinc metalloprotease protein